MTMTLTRRLFKARQRSTGPVDNALDDGVRVCAEYLATLGEDGKPDRRRMRLAAAIGSLVAASGVAASRVTASGGPSAESDPFDALLQAGFCALEVEAEPELRLALSIGDAAVAHRSRSKGAWRLRGLALQALGRDAEAVEAYERHLELEQRPDGGQVARRLAALREAQECLDEAVRLFSVRADSKDGNSGDGDSRSGNSRAGDVGHEGAEAAALLREVRGQSSVQGQSPERVGKAFAAYLRWQLRERGAGDASVRRLVELYATYRRLSAQGSRMADPLLGSSELIDVASFRKLVAGRTVCLVADADQVVRSSRGSEIDAYDLVVRFDAFRMRAAGTGSRTDVHAVSVVQGYSALQGQGPQRAESVQGARSVEDAQLPLEAHWRRPVETRLVFAESGADWQQVVREKLVPGAQRYVGDASLRRPVGDPGLIGESAGGGKAVRTYTTGFTMLRLLDFLDVSPRIDLFGFGFAGRLPAGEKEWVMAHANEFSEMRIALR